MDQPRRVRDEHNISLAAQQLFSALDIDGTKTTISSAYFIGFLKRSGLQENDLRLSQLFEYVKDLNDGDMANDYKLSLEEFDHAISSCRTLIHKVITGDMRVPSFDHHIVSTFTDMFNALKTMYGGHVATYIPQLAEVDPNYFAMSITTVDGQQFAIGDSDIPFCLQSCSKPLSYVMALEQFGARYVHHSIGTEPSGHSFNDVRLKDAPTEDKSDRQIPHNPMINAGAIVAASMIYPRLPREERMERAMDVWREASRQGETTPIGYDAAVYESESKTADRNWCLGHMMREKCSFPDCFDYKEPQCLRDTLEFYFQICSITSTTVGVSVMAATLANGGMNPFSGKRVFHSNSVRHVMPLMFSCGMYDYSGQWAYDIGVPAKSGVSGCIFIVIPNVCGICIWSPPLDSVGNSVRGVLAASELVKKFTFHNFEVFSTNRLKIDPTLRANAAYVSRMSNIMFAASEGDIRALMLQFEAGGDDDDCYDGVWMTDYDGRTALHLAASEGHAEVVQFLVDQCPQDSERRARILSATDRWGGTPLDDALHHPTCHQILERAGAVANRPWHMWNPNAQSMHSNRTQNGIERARDGHRHMRLVTTSLDAPHILFFAANGDLDELVSMVASGADLTVGDYDCRTALHVAASNNQIAVVRFLVGQVDDDHLASALETRDRWGNTPQMDAMREGNKECEHFLKRATDRVRAAAKASYDEYPASANMSNAVKFDDARSGYSRRGASVALRTSSTKLSQINRRPKEWKDMSRL